MYVSKSFPICRGTYLPIPSFFAGRTRIILQTALGGALVALPLAAFQYYGYRQFCTAGVLSEAPAWCGDPLPYLYGHVQRQYWDVGFLRYFRLQQVRRTLRSGRRWALDCTDVSLACARAAEAMTHASSSGKVSYQKWTLLVMQAPNFLLAAPILVLSSWGCFRFVSEHGVAPSARALFMPGEVTILRPLILNTLAVHTTITKKTSGQ